MKSGINIVGMMGLGDNIYQRAFIKSLKTDITLQTPWPQIYKDLHNVTCVRSNTLLRTQEKNESLQNYKTVKAHKQTIIAHYGNKPIYEGLKKCFLGMEPRALDMPDYGPSLISGEYVIIRPVTVRKEWMASTRNPIPDYVYLASKKLTESGIKIVVVADIDGENESLCGIMPEGNHFYTKGELTFEQLMSIVKHSSGIVSGVGWALPAAIAYNIPLFLLFGGQGGYNSPAMITHKSQRLEKITMAIPDNMCMCKLKTHDCNKTINNIEKKIDGWIKSNLN